MKPGKQLTLQTLFAAIIIIVAIIYALFIRPNFYNFNGGKIALETVYSENFSSKDSYQVYTYNNYLYINSKNGIKKISTDQQSIWDKSFYIANPLFITDGEYMAAIDLGGKEAFIFNEKGLVNGIKVDYPIIMADINSQGALALVEDEEGKNLIQLYNRSGILAAERGTNFATDGYPIAIDLSSTGETMVTNYLNTQEGKLKTNVTFFSFSQTGEKDPDNILGGFLLGDTMAPQVKFLDDQHVVVIGDKSLNFYNLKQTPKLVNEIKINNEINQVIFDNDGVVICYGRSTDSNGSDLSNQVVIYGFNGETLDKFNHEDDIKHLIAAGDDYFIVTSDTIEYRSTHKLIWESGINQNVKDVMKISKDKFLLVLQQGYEIVQIKDI